MCLVGADYALYQGVTHHVFVAELSKSNSSDPLEDLFRMGQSTLRAFWEINLAGIASNHGGRAKSNSREEHFHLFTGCILCLIENDKCMVERSAAHKCQRGHLDNVSLDVLVYRLKPQHFIECVVQRS